MSNNKFENFLGKLEIIDTFALIQITLYKIIFEKFCDEKFELNYI